MGKQTKIKIKKIKEKVIDYFKKIVEIIKKPEMGILPGQIAFSMILSIVPIITLIGYLANFSGNSIETITNTLDNVIPGGADYLIPYISGSTIDIRLTLILVWMFYLASGGCNSVILISNQIYGINQSTWLKRRFKAILMTIAIIIVLFFLFVIPVYGNKIISLFSFSANNESLRQALKIIKGPVIWLIMFVFLRAFYEVAPDRVRKNSHISVGAMFTTIGWIICTTIYTFLSKNLSNYNFFYGTLSNLAFLMLWLYFMSYIFVIGLSLNYAAEHSKEMMEKTGAVKVIKAK